MSDIFEVLPHFDVTKFRHLMHSLEKNNVTVTDLITLDPLDIARRCPLPLNDLKALIITVIKACHSDAGVGVSGESVTTSPRLLPNSAAVQTLDANIDACLGGGFRVGCVTEIVGESAAGKTQFAMSLLLSVQLPLPKGLGKSAIYLSTEAPLNTGRLVRMLDNHPHYESLSATERPTLDNIHAIAMNDLEMQDHIIRHQLPLAIQRFGAGLVIMDSVAANFRAEHETKTAEGLADRATELVRLGGMLRQLARTFEVAVVVINQVSDRFDDARQQPERQLISSSALNSSPSTYHHSQPANISGVANPKLNLDHQQNFFTGWGNPSLSNNEQLKNPALGFAWANQISARIVLKMDSERGHLHRRNILKQEKRRRYVGIVFAPWAPPTLNPVQYEIQTQGPVSVMTDAASSQQDRHSDLLDPNLWYDGAGDEEFP